MSNSKWNEYQNNYRKNHYKQIAAMLDPELVDRFKAKLKKNNITFPDFLRAKINEYLGEK